MKKHLFLGFALFLQLYSGAQCGSNVPGGTASNMLTVTRGAANPVAADKTLNTITFVHRNNTTAFGGTSGHLRYDVSTNAGATWTSEIGYLNPLDTSLGRYPNSVIYNPPGNTTPANAYIGYLASTISTMNAAWNGVVTGVRQISGTGNTENYNQPYLNPSYIAESLVKGAPGVFWAVNSLFNGTFITGFSIYKGTWNNGLNDIVWTNNFNVSPTFNNGLTVTGAAPADYNIAFDPTGQIGYFSFLGHISPGPVNYAYYPVLYKTTNGGATWTGPIIVDITQFSCLTTNVTVGNVPTTNFEHDLAVDVNGNPHLLTCMGNGNNAYAIYYGSWHHMFDITLKNGLWAAYDLGNVNAGRGTWGVAPNTASQDMAPRVARSSDGTKIFFTWSDNSGYTAGQANLSPNMFSKAYNVQTDMWTPTKDFSSCGPLAGKIIFPHVAAEVLEPSTNVYKLAPFYGEYSTPANDPNLVCNFQFMDNATYALAEFSVATPVAVVNITPSPVLLCPGSTVNIALANPLGQFLWSTGATTSVIPISSGPSYSVIAQQACLVGTANVTVNNMTFSANVLNPNICQGSSGTFTVAGNALGYTWTPGNATGTNVPISPTATTVTVTAQGSGCTSTKTVLVNMLPQPTLNVAGNNTICAGSILSQTLSGAQTYTWSTGPTGATFTDNPISNTVYTVTGTAANSCTNTLNVFVVVNPKPTLSASSNPTTVCSGQTVGLTANGAVSYSWNSVPSPTNTTTVTPNVTTVFTVTGEDANLCTNTQTVQVIVNPTPTLIVSSSPTAVCIGKTATLTASGAFSYSWNAITSPATTTVAPTVATVYTVTGTSTLACKATETINVVVNALPSVSITAERTKFCKGENLTLTASGAVSYTWASPSTVGASISVSPPNSTTFSVTGSNAEGCTSMKTYSIVVLSCSGIEETSGALQLTIYPNPNTGAFTIRGTGDLKLIIVNELGQLVKQIALSENNQHEAVIHELPPGVYFITSRPGEPTVREKIVVTR